ncbi:AraC family transcriptional regulator [Stenotrophomonas mori]|uniref:Helix-turn-helix transcriptional regulator n=1 Tax=Stenotrophomonas mori TaxID=2871096 RepID=A0ABT0SEG6_9GAMM|nr:helix-turn-helix transcriptional regulator [Stenotrophomonas mori]MCL7713710.1 helix-turn-helix transcriptional regulator [Stenotrophomonas mori]
MAWLAPEAGFDADAWAAPVIGIASTLADHDSGWHGHRRGQLLYARQGCTRLTFGDRLCLLPPSRAAWIPGGLVHRAQMRQAVDYRSLYFTPDVCRQLPARPVVIAVSPLLEALLEPIAQAPFTQDWSQPRAHHQLALCVLEIAAAPVQPMDLPLPRDPRIAGQLPPAECLPPALDELSRRCGLSTRTIARAMQRDVGMGYQAWRQQWRLMRAMELLLLGHAVGHVAQELGFSAESPFIAFFRGMTGTTPAAFRRRPPG